MSDSEHKSHLLISPARIDRIITRIAYQIYEHTRGSDQLVVFGIDSRGYKLSKLLAVKLSEIYDTEIIAHPIYVKDHTGKESHNVSNPPVSGKRVVIVDDVMYSGKTMYRALLEITGREHPADITLAALVDRGHRHYPLNIQYVGLYCPTKLQEHVHCSFSESGVPEGVWLETADEQ
ncbi:phosphoribosyltransferase family protein [Balneolales bacterium ANBcel1]|nr:phosphoribosyltransferase family protein [Balneolales bacterium ANBcel1]